MIRFRDKDAAEAAIDRIQAMPGGPSGRFFLECLKGNPDPDRAVVNLERWLGAVGSPALHLGALESSPPLAKYFLVVLGASQPLADTLIQNPELASVLLDPAELNRIPTREAIEAEGRRLLAAATSPSHALDRLRFLKQRWTLPIVLNDLAGTWPQPAVWRALSDLADAIIALAREAVWRQRNPDSDCPVTIIAFGKLGGREVNYSSDVDLVYVLPDDADERVEREATRFAEAFGRALSDRMGRGALFRVDLRLRPYGGTGSILRRMKSYEGYYDLYAEPWEGQALMRSRPVAGAPEVMRRWEEMRVARCFRAHLGESALREMLAMRTRIEEFAEENDIKRGSGGIRDIEFTVQILQMAFGHAHPEFRVLPTLEALHALSAQSKLSEKAAHTLEEGYVFLRKLEHRLQLLGDRQTHAIPDDPVTLATIARLMGFPSAHDLERETRSWRRRVSTLYEAILHPDAPPTPPKTRVMRELGALGQRAEKWFDALPESEAFWAALAENEDSIENVRVVLEFKPALLELIRRRVGVTERILSGEIDEPGDLFLPMERRAGRDPDAFARAYQRGWLGTLARGTDVEAGLTEGLDRLVRMGVKRVGGGLAVFALGSWGNQDTGPMSDADLFLLADGIPQAEAEVRGQKLVAFLGEVRRAGAPIAFDLRLRPDGGKGLLVRTPEGIEAYDLEGMDMWERFALGHARQVTGDPALARPVHRAADGQPLDPERTDELLRMKRRIETERVVPHHVHRDPKLGTGGLSDAEWTIRMLEMRYPLQRIYGTLDERAGALFRAGLLAPDELTTLKEGRRWMKDVRNQVWLLGFEDGLIPENPDRLDLLARAFHIESGNAFLKVHRATTARIRETWLRTAEEVKR